MVKVVIVFRDPNHEIKKFDARFIKVHDWFLQVALPGSGSNLVEESLYFSAAVIDHVDFESTSSIDERRPAEKAKVVVIFRDPELKPAKHDATFAKARGGFFEVATVAKETFCAKYYPVDLIDHVEYEGKQIFTKPRLNPVSIGNRSTTRKRDGN